MSTLLEKILIKYPVSIITEAELYVLLGNTSADSRRSRIKRAISSGQLIKLKRGIYCIGEEYQQSLPHNYEIGQQLYAPCYLSFESALSYHGLIPEKVAIHTFASTHRTKTIETPLGTFTYNKLPLKHFYDEVISVNENNHYFLVAKPWKALLDYVLVRKPKETHLLPLLASLRIDSDDLPTIGNEALAIFSRYYQNKRIKAMLGDIKRTIDGH